MFMRATAPIHSILWSTPCPVFGVPRSVYRNLKVVERKTRDRVFGVRAADALRSLGHYRQEIREYS